MPLPTQQVISLDVSTLHTATAAASTYIQPHKSCRETQQQSSTSLLCTKFALRCDGSLQKLEQSTDTLHMHHMLNAHPRPQNCVQKAEGSLSSLPWKLCTRCCPIRGQTKTTLELCTAACEPELTGLIHRSKRGAATKSCRLHCAHVIVQKLCHPVKTQIHSTMLNQCCQCHMPLSHSSSLTPCTTGRVNSPHDSRVVKNGTLISIQVAYMKPPDDVTQSLNSSPAADTVRLESPCQSLLVPATP